MTYAPAVTPPPYRLELAMDVRGSTVDIMASMLAVRLGWSPTAPLAREATEYILGLLEWKAAVERRKANDAANR